MQHIEIRIELLRRGENYSSVARKLKISRQLVRYAIHGKGRHGKIIKIRREISKAIGKPVSALWPDQKNRKAA